MKYAAIQALQGEPVESSDEEVLAPKITSRYGFYSSPSSTIYMSIDKAENTTARYTEDGTDPDVSSTKAETNSVSFTAILRNSKKYVLQPLMKKETAAR